MPHPHYVLRARTYVCVVIQPFDFCGCTHTGSSYGRARPCLCAQSRVRLDFCVVLPDFCHGSTQFHAVALTATHVRTASAAFWDITQRRSVTAAFVENTSRRLRWDNNTLDARWKNRQQRQQWSVWMTEICRVFGGFTGPPVRLTDSRFSVLFIW